MIEEFDAEEDRPNFLITLVLCFLIVGGCVSAGVWAIFYILD